MTTTITWPLQHWAGLSGRIMVKRGPHACTITDEAHLLMLIKSVQKNATGTVRRSGVVLDESELLQLRATYYPQAEQRPDIDADTFTLGFDVEDNTEPVTDWTDEHGFDRTPGQWPSAVWGI